MRVYAGVRSSTKAETFDQLRLAYYLSGIGIDTLPPTSSVIRGHTKNELTLCTRHVHFSQSYAKTWME